MGWYLYHLIVDDTIRIGDVCQERKQVCSDRRSTYIDGKKRSHERWQVYLVHIHQREGFDDPVTDAQTVIRTLEISHAERSFLELERHETVQVFVYLFLV